MNIAEKISNWIHVTATGNRIKSAILAPIVGGAFSLVTALFIIVPVFIENKMNLPKLFSPPLNLYLGLPFIIAGIFLMMWTNWYFLLGKRTPVPVNPPAKLIYSGPYRYTRNPMHTGLFLLMFGIGIYYDSILTVFIFIPLYIFLDVWMIIRIEEPGLERRFGNDYLEYRAKVPRFLPHLFR